MLHREHGGGRPAAAADLVVDVTDMMLDGIVKLSRIGRTDPLHTRLTTGSSPSSWGSISRVFVNLTVPYNGFYRGWSITSLVQHPESND